MRIGTKSVLFGVHQFLIHPVLIAIGWWIEYGFRRVPIGHRPIVRRRPYGGHFALVPVHAHLLNPRLWVAFFVHDLGYIGKPNMDGPEGETHPEFGARVMRALFGEPWGQFVLLHSRYYAKRLGKSVSPLCHADKRVIVIEPWWLYLPRVWATGELAEFMAVARRRGETMAGPNDPLTPEERAAFLSGSARQWHRTVRAYMRRWLAEHRDGKSDTWTRLRHPTGGAA